MSWILDDNVLMNRAIHRMGGFSSCSPRGWLRGALHHVYPMLLISRLWREIGFVNQMFVSTYQVPIGICDVPWPYPVPTAVTEGFMYGVMGILYRHFEVDGTAFPSRHVTVSHCTLTFSWRYLKRIR